MKVMLAVFLFLLPLVAQGEVTQNEIVVLSDCESIDHWRGVELTEDARVGRHAVRFRVPPGQVAGATFEHGHLPVDWTAGGELQFYYRFTGTGRSSLMVKLLAFPFADGWQATWQVAEEQEADGAWHLGVVDLGAPFMKWGQAPDSTSRLLIFRTQASPEARLTLDIDQVRLVPRLFSVRVVDSKLLGESAEATLELENITATPLDVTIGGTTPAKRLSLASKQRLLTTVRVRFDSRRIAKASPLTKLEQTLTVEAAGKDFSRKEVPVSVVVPLKLPPHPRLLLTAGELPRLRERAQSVAWARAFFEQQKKIADDWLGKAVVLPPRGSQWWHWYACKEDGARLKTLSPSQHQCPVCGKVYTGWPYDDVVLSREHSRLAEALRTLGLVYQLTGDKRYAAKAKEILLAYAEQYERYPLHDIHGKEAVGGGRVGPQTLDESTWLIPVCQGADLIWETLSPEERERAASGLFRPAAEVIRQHRMGIHNIQCWKNSAVGLVGLLLDDAELIWDAVKSPHGFESQIAQGITTDGQWFEGAWGYHFYTMSAILPLAEAGERCGLQTYAFERNGRSYRRLFEAPLDLAMPNLLLPAFNDSGTSNLKSAAYLYECGLARYHDARFARVLEGSSRQTLEAFIIGLDPLPKPPAESAGSRNFPGAGYVVLRHGEDAEAAWVCLKYGPHGGGHGHPDKLNFVSYFRGQILAFDPGTTAYGVPLQSEWYRTTLAHNTLTVDQRNQQSAQGRCLAFGKSAEISAALAEAGPIYEGVLYRRAIGLFGKSLLLVLDLVEAEKERTFDLAYHNAGRWETPAAGNPVRIPDADGYKHLRDVVKVEAMLPPVVVGADVKIGLAVTSLPLGETWAGTGVGSNATDRVPCVIQRVRGKSAVVGWGISLTGEPIRLELSSQEMETSLTAAIGGESYLLRITAGAPPGLVAQHGLQQLVATSL